MCFTKIEVNVYYDYKKSKQTNKQILISTIVKKKEINKKQNERKTFSLWLLQRTTKKIKQKTWNLNNFFFKALLIDN